MISRTLDDDHHRFKLRQSVLQEWMSKTLESERFQDMRSKTNNHFKPHTPLISQTCQPSRTIDDRIPLNRPQLKPRKSKLKSSLPKKIQHLILNQGLSKMQQESSPLRQNRFSESFNNFVFNYKPRITNSIQHDPKRTLDQNITKSLDLSHKYENKIKKTPPNPRLGRQFKAIITKMKFLLDTYKAREQTLLSYIGKLQLEISTLKKQ